MSKVHEGGCLCREIRYRIRGGPMRVSACYCTFCQRRTGGALSIHAFFDEQNIELIGDGFTTYEHHSDESGLYLRLHSCKRCAFGDETTLLVTNMEQGRDLAHCLDRNRLALMRGHGFVCVGRTINDLVRLAVHIPRNARVQLAAMQMGEYKPLSRGEVEARLKLDPDAPTMKRGWEYWAREAGCEDLL